MEPDKDIDVIGFDSYNLCLTGDLARSIASSRADAEHQPCVLIIQTDRNDE